jgi:NAD(P)-dependent dehydrogenase (short-subunit alcohol dehydrogenase family)
MRLGTSILMAIVWISATAWGQPSSDVDGSSLDSERSTVLITGSNRGIGLGFATHYANAGWNVIATARSPDQADELNDLAAHFDHVVIEELDVTDQSELDFLSDKYAQTAIDVVINNAAYHGGNAEDHRIGTFSSEVFETYMAVNVFGPLAVSEAFLPSVLLSDQKKIVTLSSVTASLSNLPPIIGLDFQQISKTAVNKAMRVLQVQLQGTGVLLALISPSGTVRTDGLAAAAAAIRSNGGRVRGLPPPDGWQPRQALAPEESAAAMAKVIEGLDDTYDGSHLDSNGNVIPW